MADPTLEEVQARLANARPLLERIGAMLVRESQAAFGRQRSPAGVQWPPRYPFQRGPAVNIAGLVADLEAGRDPKRHRFQRRPAGVDTGRLRDSITYRITGAGEVEVYSPMTERAERIHAGGVSKQRLTKDVKKRLAKWLKAANPPKSIKQKVGFLFARDELVTKVAARPFLDMAPDAEDRIASLTASYLEGRLTDSGQVVF